MACNIKLCVALVWITHPTIPDSPFHYHIHTQQNVTGMEAWSLTLITSLNSITLFCYDMKVYNLRHEYQECCLGEMKQVIGTVQWNLIKNTPELTTTHAEIRTWLNIMHQHTDVMSLQLIYCYWSSKKCWSSYHQQYSSWNTYHGDSMGLDIYIFQFQSWCVFWIIFQNSN